VPQVDVDDVTLHYEVEGDGPTVLLIHGLAGDSTAWAPQVAALRDRYRLIAFDNRGAGRSTQREEAVDTLRMAHDTIGLLDALGVEDAHIVGRSMGGAIAQHVALLAPDRVRSLVLCASFAKLDPLGFRVLTNMREVLEWRGSWLDHARHSIANFVSREFHNANPDTVARTIALIASADRLPACYIAQNHACLLHDTLADLPRITCPTFVLSGEVDPICSPDATRWLVDGLPDATAREFAGASHFFLLEQPDAFLQELEEWLDGHG
jgi:3-oxoadipate enol-lactonase